MMTKQDIAYVLHEIRNMDYYNVRLREIEETLERLSDELESCGSPHCPLGNTQPSGAGKPVASRMNEIISEESWYLGLKKHYGNCLFLATRWYEEILEACDTTNEKRLIEGFVNGDSYNKLMNEYHITNVYLTISRIVQRIDY